KKFLGHIALLESKSDHPVAKVIQFYIESQEVVSTSRLAVASIDTTHHSGIKGQINGERFMIGTKNMLSDNGVKHIDEPYDNPENGSVYIVRGKKVIGQIALT